MSRFEQMPPTHTSAFIENLALLSKEKLDKLFAWSHTEILYSMAKEWHEIKATPKGVVGCQARYDAREKRTIIRATDGFEKIYPDSDIQEGRVKGRAAASSHLCDEFAQTWILHWEKQASLA